MSTIRVLDSHTVNKIAAGEVVERPASVVKELVENAMDAGATNITVEIKDGGIKMIRVTDNGCGMDKQNLLMCFERHATSKIQKEEDLNKLVSLGFRGEALSSIASVSIVEALTREQNSLIGNRLYMEGGKNPEISEAGLPTGTTMIVRNLFYNTPARKKFLRSSLAEMNTISDLMIHLALSRPDIAFSYIANKQTKFHTLGNLNLRDVIYEVYGRDIAKALIPVSGTRDGYEISGFLGKPELVRGSRGYETYFINGRYIKSEKIAGAIEAGAREFLMQHKFPFCVLHIRVEPSLVDVNVHPTKMEVRFDEQCTLPQFIQSEIECALKSTELLQEGLTATEPEPDKKQQDAVPIPEPFEHRRLEQLSSTSIWEQFKQNECYVSKQTIESEPQVMVEERQAEYECTQSTLFDNKLLSYDKSIEYQYIGQIFDTYWLIQWKDQFLMIDQHAAHEKVKYERLMKQFHNKEVVSQYLNPPIIISLTGEEEAVFLQFRDCFQGLGFCVEEFGGREYALRQVPLDLYGYGERELFLGVLDELLSKGSTGTLEVIAERIATMACRAAVKGNHKLSESEAKELIGELLTLNNPYNCPHGRPTAIVMSKYEIEKKFKRIVE